MMKKKFVIVSPRQSCGGPVVLHLLCKLLLEKGYDAKIFYIGPTSMKRISYLRYWLKYAGFIYRDIARIIKVKLFPKKYGSDHRYNGYNYEAVRGCPRKYLPFTDDDTIVVYPELIWGNPLKAKNVVRWFLSFNPYVGEEAYGKNDLVISYREIFNDKELNPECRLCYMTNFDYDLYKQNNFGERKGTCYIIRKGKDRKDLPKDFDGPIIDTMSEQDIVKTFNTCERCISYDTQTFYTSIAAMCGCLPIVVTEPGKTRSDYTRQDDTIYGVAYGFDEKEINYALDTRKALTEHIDGFKKINQEGVENFIRECEKFFS